MLKPKKYAKKPIVIEAIQFTGDNMMACLEFCPIGEEEFEQIYIPTLEGEMTCTKGDWIIKGIKGEFYPCKPDIFEKSYEEVSPALDFQI